MEIIAYSITHSLTQLTWCARNWSFWQEVEWKPKYCTYSMIVGNSMNKASRCNVIVLSTVLAVAVWALSSSWIHPVIVFTDVCAFSFPSSAPASCLFTRGATWYVTEVLQVTRLVITEIQSESFRLVTERRHYNSRPNDGSALMLHMFYFPSLSVALCTFSVHVQAMHVFNVWASSSLTRLPLCQISFLSPPPLLS